MLLDLVLLIIRFAFLAGLLSFVVFLLRAMIEHMPKPDAAQRPARRPGSEALRQAQGSGGASQGMPAPTPLLAREAARPQPQPAAAQLRGTARPGPSRRAGRSIAILEVVDPAGSSLSPGQQFQLGPRNHIGRAPENTLVVDDVHVSRNHAFIGQRGSTWVLVDKGSANGTFLRGQRITRPAILRDGDVVSFGAVTFCFRMMAADG
ncbi:MAG: FHA domain-containing protein [Armatimonadetes bacterium]|nr:FHA domain-containing protein [Armatimonadota bacterium]